MTHFFFVYFKNNGFEFFSVGLLANAIEHHFSIEKQKQILLISGGEILNDNTQKLYRLSAGRVT